MQREANKTTVRAFLDAVRTRDRDAVDALLAEDGAFWLIGATATLAKPAFMRIIDRLWDMLEGPALIEIIHLTAEEDRVSILGIGRMRSKAGKPYENTYHILAIVDRGQIQAWNEYFDTRIAAQAFPR